MNIKTISVLAVTIMVVAGAWKISQQKAPQREVQRTPLYPALIERLNDVRRVQLSSRDEQTVLVRDGESWAIENKDNFAANSGDVKRTLLQLADLRSVEAKTRNSERFQKLGVDDISNDGADGTLIEVLDAENAALTALIIGHSRSGSTRDQYYVRRHTEDQSWLVEGALDAPTDPIRWLDASILDVDSTRVREVRITTPDGAPIVISKAAADDNFFSLQNIPDGFEAKSKASVSSLGALLGDLRFNDVASIERIATATPLRQVQLTTFDGLAVTIDAFELDDKKFMRFQFAYDADSVVTAAKAIEDSPAAAAQADVSDTVEVLTQEADASDDGLPEKENAESVAEFAARLQAKTAGWVYVLPDYKSRLYERNFESLIKAVEPTTETQ